MRVAQAASAGSSSSGGSNDVPSLPAGLPQLGSPRWLPQGKAAPALSQSGHFPQRLPAAGMPGRTAALSADQIRQAVDSLHKAQQARRLLEKRRPRVYFAADIEAAATPSARAGKKRPRTDATEFSWMPEVRAMAYVFGDARPPAWDTIEFLNADALDWVAHTAFAVHVLCGAGALTLRSLSAVLPAQTHAYFRWRLLRTMAKSDGADLSAGGGSADLSVAKAWAVKGEDNDDSDGSASDESAGSGSDDDHSNSDDDAEGSAERRSASAAGLPSAEEPGDVDAVADSMLHRDLTATAAASIRKHMLGTMPSSDAGLEEDALLASEIRRLLVRALSPRLATPRPHWGASVRCTRATLLLLAFPG